MKIDAEFTAQKMAETRRSMLPTILAFEARYGCERPGWSREETPAGYCYRRRGLSVIPTLEPVEPGVLRLVVSVARTNGSCPSPADLEEVRKAFFPVGVWPRQNAPDSILGLQRLAYLVAYVEEPS